MYTEILFLLAYSCIIFTRHGVASASDSVTRKLGGSVDWNDPDLVRKLYALFLGTLVIKVT